MLSITKQLLGLLGCIFLGSHNPIHHMDELDDGSFTNYTHCSRCGKVKSHA